MKKIIFLYFFILTHNLFSQNIAFEEKNITFLNTEGKALTLATAGGLNAPQINTLDLNQDGKEDLVIFDRSTQRITTFLAQNSQYIYAPQYFYLFPKDLQAFLLLKDLNQDGLKDLLTYQENQILVFQQIKKNNQITFEKLSQPLQTFQNKIKKNILIPITDFPFIDDIDEDGHLDLLVFDLWQGKTIEWHRQIDKKNFDFELKTETWANLEEGQNCGEFYFPKKNNQKGGGELTQILHTGSTIQIFDVNNDKKVDLLIGDAACEDLYVFLNEGNNKKPKFSKYITQFPTQKPISIGTFPILFWVDVNFDGKKDLLAAPNLFVSSRNQVNFSQSLALYVEEKKAFTFVKNNFLQDEMIDEGEKLKINWNENNLVLQAKNQSPSFFEPIYKNQQLYFQELKTEGVSDWENIEIPTQIIEDFDLDTFKDTLYIDTKGFITHKGKKIIENLGIFPYILAKDWNNDKKIDLVIGTWGGGILFFENKSKGWQLEISILETKKMMMLKSYLSGKLTLKNLNNNQIYAKIPINALQETPLEIKDLAKGKYIWILEIEKNNKTITMEWEF
jgi:hypothetical protein